MARAYSTRKDPWRELFVDASGDYQRGADVRAAQEQHNARRNGGRAYLPKLEVDGVCGPATFGALIACGRALGALESTLGIRDTKGRRVVTIGVQHMIRNPQSRTPTQLQRALNAVAKPSPSSPRAKAVAWALAQVGTMENPPGSNRGGKITQWQQALGAWLVGLAWCGVFCAAALRAAGVQGVNSRLASVAFIEDDARAHRAPFRGWTTSTKGVLRGDLAVIGGRGVHVEVVEKVYADGSASTIGGNTSPGTAGSQSNGGGVFHRHRSRGEIHGFALVNFPG